MKKIDRFEFLQLAGGILGAGIAAAATACGGDDAAAPGGPACDSHAPSVSIGSNHGHALSVSAADAKAGTMKMYSIQGSAPHDHEVILNAGNFQDLEAGRSVSTGSGPGGADGHIHQITISCA